MCSNYYKEDCSANLNSYYSDNCKLISGIRYESSFSSSVQLSEVLVNVGNKLKTDKVLL